MIGLPVLSAAEVVDAEYHQQEVDNQRQDHIDEEPPPADSRRRRRTPRWIADRRSGLVLESGIGQAWFPDSRRRWPRSSTDSKRSIVSSSRKTESENDVSLPVLVVAHGCCSTLSPPSGVVGGSLIGTAESAVRSIVVKSAFYVFLSRASFLTFFNVFILRTFFIFKNVHWKYHLKSLSKQQKQIGSVWLFFFVPMLEFPYRPIYWQALLFTYRIGLHQVMPLGVVFLFMLVNWWVEKHRRFLFNVYKCFSFIFLSLFYVFWRFLFFFSGTFLHLWCDPSAAQMGPWTD